MFVMPLPDPCLIAASRHHFYRPCQVPVIGEIDFHLTHIELVSFTIGACNATFAAPEGVGVVVSDLSMALTLDWQLRFYFLVLLSICVSYCFTA